MKMILQFQKKKTRCASSDELHTKLQQKIRTLQQKLRRTKKTINTMHDVIQFLEEKLVLNTKESEALLSTVNNTQLKFLFQDNTKSAPSARRYSDEIKEFALTLYFYSILPEHINMTGLWFHSPIHH
jgi:transcriptional regulator CtsR